MRILYVCPCWPGIIEAYNEGKEPNGMPGFFYVLKELIDQKNEVDLCIFTSREIYFGENKIRKNHWFSKINIVGVIKLKDYVHIRRIIYELFLPVVMNNNVNRLLNIKKYDFVYGQGNYADCARIAAAKHNTHFALRKYGDDFAPLLKQNGIVKAVLRSPAAALSYITKKDFILATNDGTEIDKICARFRRKMPYEVYLWNNGFNPDIGYDTSFEQLTKVPYIFQFSRFVKVKGQLDIIDAFNFARKKGFLGHLVLAGTPDDINYYKEIKNKIDYFGIGEYVKFIGKITAEQTKFLTEKSLANIISGINYNVNNVFIESLGYGGVVIVRDTPLIDKIIKNGINGFVFSNIEGCGKVILDLYYKKYDAEIIRKNAINTCIEVFGTWKNRAEKEVALINKYVSC